jgi:leader peptidase (prepilin peptidase)/N-methyltransferase
VNPTGISIIIFLFGLCIGSFLNVCIYRLPKEQSIVFPASHCPLCNVPIAWYDNIPLVSFVLLKRRCRFCKQKISWIYPLVETLTALIWVILYWRFGLNGHFFAYGLLSCGLIIATFVDLEQQIIPDEVSIGGALAGLVISLIYPALHGEKVHLFGLLRSLLGVVVGGGGIFLTGLLGNLIFRKESMGGGDVKLMAAIGAFLGWRPALLTFFMAPFFGSITGIILWLKKRTHVIAFGPYLALACFICILWWQEIWKKIFPLM